MCVCECECVCKLPGVASDCCDLSVDFSWMFIALRGVFVKLPCNAKYWIFFPLQNCNRNPLATKHFHVVANTYIFHFVQMATA